MDEAAILRNEWMKLLYHAMMQRKHYQMQNKDRRLEKSLKI